MCARSTPASNGNRRIDTVGSSMKLQEPAHLGRHERATSDRACQDRLVDHHVEAQWRGAVERLLPSHAQLYELVNLLA